MYLNIPTSNSVLHSMLPKFIAETKILWTLLCRPNIDCDVPSLWPNIDVTLLPAYSLRYGSVPLRVAPNFEFERTNESTQAIHCYCSETSDVIQHIKHACEGVSC